MQFIIMVYLLFRFYSTISDGLNFNLSRGSILPLCKINSDNSKCTQIFNKNCNWIYFKIKNQYFICDQYFWFFFSSLYYWLKLNNIICYCTFFILYLFNYYLSRWILKLFYLLKKWRFDLRVWINPKTERKSTSDIITSNLFPIEEPKQ